ncbi:MAG: hypothetical protein AB2552_19180 [Candidatus Thiodiazotropha endolucinida]
MKLVTKHAHALSGNPWFIIIGTISSISAFLWYMYDKALNYPTVLSGIYLFASVSILLVGVIYSIKVRSENYALRKIAETFNEINHIYRDTLREMFGGDDPVTNPVDLLVEEERALRSVCQRVENIFSRVINRDCMVTIKLNVKEDDGRYFTYTYVRSLDNSKRDKPIRRRYEVGTGANTGFDVAIQKRVDSNPSHFYSPDLTKEHGYSNERQHFEKCYRSTIVVPIRGVNKGMEGTDLEFDMIGYLCVDTKSTHRLNDGYHLQMMSSLAVQMYNFMSLMRGRYTVFVE